MTMAQDIFLSLECGVEDDEETTKDKSYQNEETSDLLPPRLDPNILTWSPPTSNRGNAEIEKPEPSHDRLDASMPSSTEPPAKRSKGRPGIHSIPPPISQISPRKTKMPPKKKCPQRQASLEIPKRIAEFAQQAKLIKMAIVKEKLIEKNLASLPKGAKPTQSQGVTKKRSKGPSKNINAHHSLNNVHKGEWPCLDFLWTKI
jgi:hypothetical protein